MIEPPNLIQMVFFVLNTILLANPYLRQVCNRVHCYNNIHVYMIEFKNKHIYIYIYIYIYILVYLLYVYMDGFSHQY